MLTEKNFLDAHCQYIIGDTLRYETGKFQESKRQKYLKRLISLI